MTITALITHSGGFHADELLSSVILTRLFPQANLVRSRDAAWITPAFGHLIYDVGGLFDADLQIFDHHQRGAPLRDDGQPFSSFGLIWRHYGVRYLADSGIPHEHISQIHTKFDQEIVLYIDLLDNGALSPSVAGPLAPLTLPELLESLSPAFDARDPESEDLAFGAALALARQLVESIVKKYDANLRAQSIVVKSIQKAGAGQILELPQNMPFLQTVIDAGADHLLFVIAPRDSDWTLGGIRRTSHEFTLRADLPSAWAGLNGQVLEETSGVLGANFCHNGRFIATATSYEAILKLAQIAVETAEATKS